MSLYLKNTKPDKLDFQTALDAVKKENEKKGYTLQQNLDRLYYLISTSKDENPIIKYWVKKWGDFYKKAIENGKENVRPSSSTNNTYNNNIKEFNNSNLVNGGTNKIITKINNNENPLPVKRQKKSKKRKEKNKTQETQPQTETQSEEEGEDAMKTNSFGSLDHHPRRKYIYLPDQIVKSCAYDPDEEWIEERERISEILSSFRSSSITLYNSDSDLSPCRLLSLRFIYPILFNFEKSATKYAGRSIHSKIVNDLKKRSNLNEVNLAKRAKSWHEDLIELNENDSYVKIVLIVSKFVTLASESKDATEIIAPNIPGKCSGIEDTHVHMYVEPFVKPIFSEDRVLDQDWANASLEALKNTEFKSVYKPDWVAYSTPRSKRYDLAIAEVKAPGKTNVGNISDFEKLGIELQIMMDVLVEERLVDDPAVFGILVEGNNVKTFKMDLKHDGEYRYIQTAEFGLVTRFYESGAAPAAFKYFQQFKEEVTNMANCIEVNELKRARGIKVEVNCNTTYIRKQSLKFKRIGKPLE